MHRNGFIAAAVVAGLIPAAPARAATTTVTFAATGREQAFIVPAGLTRLHVVATGARGGDGFGGIGLPGAPGKGARVEGDLPVTPGQTLFVEVGTTPAAPDFNAPAAGGFNGGGTGVVGAGGGGGASDVRAETATDPGSAASRLLVAAGGGGAGEYGFLNGTVAGGSGGDAGAAGTAGANNNSVVGGSGGGSGTASAGGTGGSGGAGPGEAGHSGSAGAAATGGTGGAPGLDSASGGGGGGGGGLYGGGGGGGGGCCQAAGGGGGGGSSLVPSGAAPALDATGVPAVTISYEAPTADLSTTALAFAGVQPLGTVSAPQAVTIANHGSAPLAITGLSFAGTDAGDFLLGSSTCGGPVPVGSSCTVTVRFAPSAGGVRTARLAVAGNAPATGVDLSGTGGSLPAGVRGEPGPPGPAGANGAPGSVELVTCTTKKVKKRAKTTCRGGLVSGPLKFVFGHGATVARATLLRGGTVVARGTAVRHGKRMRLLFGATRALRHGRYTLRLPHRRLTVALR